MKEHYHLTVENVLIYGVSALIVFNLTKIVAVKLANMQGPIGSLGHALGTLVTFGS